LRRIKAVILNLFQDDEGVAMTDYPHGMQKEKPDGWVAITAGLLLDTQNGLGAVSNRIE
jgi:hypothetical protein